MVYRIDITLPLALLSGYQVLEIGTYAIVALPLAPKGLEVRVSINIEHQLLRIQATLVAVGGKLYISKVP